MKTSLNPRIRRIVAVLACAGILAGGWELTVARLGTPAMSDATAAASAPSVPTHTATVLPDFASLVARYGPAVVRVSVVGKARTADANADDADGIPPFFRRFVPPDNAPSRGVGSGFIVSADGVILTNAHVVDGADEVTVRLTDKREFTAKVLGTDDRTDVAVLKIDAKGLPVVSTGSSGDVRVGDWVLAIGSPYGLDNTVTAGIVSAKSRSLPSDSYVPFLQTDVAVNPGNSGGPLFDAAGAVVGINSQIFSRTGGYQGLSFAIPIEVALQVKDEILAHGRVDRGWLGITLQEMSQGLASSFGLAKPEGALVNSIAPGSPAEKAGLKAGDVIVEVDRTAIGGPADVPSVIGRLHPGTKVKMQVWRNGHAQTIDATLAQAPDLRAKVADAGDASGRRLGLAVRPLTPEERGASGLANGLIVEDVRGAAARAGIQPGDVILSISGTPVQSVEDLQRVLKQSGSHIALLVQRDGVQVFVPITVGKA